MPKFRLRDYIDYTGGDGHYETYQDSYSVTGVATEAHGGSADTYTDTWNAGYHVNWSSGTRTTTWTGASGSRSITMDSASGSGSFQVTLSTPIYGTVSLLWSSSSGASGQPGTVTVETSQSTHNNVLTVSYSWSNAGPYVGRGFTVSYSSTKRWYKPYYYFDAENYSAADATITVGGVTYEFSSLSPRSASVGDADYTIGSGTVSGGKVYVSIAGEYEASDGSPPPSSGVAMPTITLTYRGTGSTSYYTTGSTKIDSVDTYDFCGSYGGGITSVSAYQNGSYVYWTAYSNSATSNGYFTIYTTYQSWVPGDKEYFFKIKFNGQPIGRYIKINGVLYDAEDQNI